MKTAADDGVARDKRVRGKGLNELGGLRAKICGSHGSARKPIMAR